MTISKNARTLLAASLLCLVIGSGNALAFPQPGKADAPLPIQEAADIKSLFKSSAKDNAKGGESAVHDIHDDVTFKEKTKSYHVIPFNDTNLEFEISLPADWLTDKISLGNATDTRNLLLGDIARFRSPYIGTSQAIVTVQAQQINREISAENWLKNYILTNGYSLQDEVTETDIRRASASYIYVQEGVSTYTYITVQINGGLILLARFEVPLALKDYIAFLQKKSIDSFRLIYMNDSPIEELKVFTLVDAVKFSYPQSWEIVAPDFKDMNRISVQLHNRNTSKAVEGYINCLAVRRSPDTTFKKESARLKKTLTEFLGVEFKSLTSSDKYHISDRFLLSQVEKYEVGFKKKRQADQELHMLILGDREWYIFMYLITPKEQDNLSVWAHNIRSFDVITKSIK